MKIRLLESAKEDLRDGYAFYETQSVGLGSYFLDCLQSDVQSLIIYAGIHESCDGFCRLLSKRFPFAVYYTLDEDIVDVYAVLDCRRDPKWVKARLTKSGDLD